MSKNSFDHTKPFQLHDGRPARLLRVNPENLYYPLEVLVTLSDNETIQTTYTKNGCILKSLEGTESPFNLVNIPENSELVTLRRGLESCKLAPADYWKHTERAERTLPSKHLGKNHLQGALDEIDDLRAQLNEYKEKVVRLTKWRLP